MIPMTSPTYRVISMRSTSQKTVEPLDVDSIVRLKIDLQPTSRRGNAPYAMECYLERQSLGCWVRCSDYLTTNNMLKKLCIVPRGIDPTPYAKMKSGPVLTLVEA
jgi:hypothetical protein